MKLAKNKKIFVSIPAWEDPDLINTIKDCIEKANSPENIIFGLSIKYKNEPDFSFLPNKIHILRQSDYENSPGIIQIRDKIRNLVTDETFFLGIDAHTRFEQDWDSKLIKDLEELHRINNKFIISKQLINKRSVRDYRTKLKIQSQLGMKSLDIVGHLEPIYSYKDYSSLDINGKYILNWYASGNFIFAKSEFIKNINFPNYHKYKFEELEMSIVLYCNGYILVSPLKNNSYIYAWEDSKYIFPYEEKYWEFVGSDKNNPLHWRKKWNRDEIDDSDELIKFMLTGKNKYFSVLNLKKDIKDFYKDIDLYEEWKMQKIKRNLEYEVKHGR